MPHFAYRILPPRADFVAPLTEDERAIMGAHFHYLSALNDAGKVVFVGRCENGDYGFGVFDLAYETEFNAVVDSDPAVSSGLMKAERHAFKTIFSR